MKQNKHPQNFFRLRRAEPKGTFPNFLSTVSKTRKKSQKCAQLAAIWNMPTWKRICNFKTCVFFQGDILQNFSACGGPKSLGTTGGAPPKPPKKIALPKNMYNQQNNYVFKWDKKMCTYGSILGEKIKNSKRKKNKTIVQSWQENASPWGELHVNQKGIVKGRVFIKQPKFSLSQINKKEKQCQFYHWTLPPSGTFTLTRIYW